MINNRYIYNQFIYLKTKKIQLAMPKEKDTSETKIKL
jgi:hypothetical protein